MRYVLTLIIVLTSCRTLGGPPCEPTTTRCDENVAQVCDASGRWQEVMVCDEVEPGDWECRVDGGEHTCMPTSREGAE